MFHPQPPPLPHATTAVHGCATSHGHQSLQSLLMKCAIASAPAKSLSLQQITFIEKRFQDFSSTVHTPDHPPYACMIENAITHLNEEGGSNEEAISKFILEEYKDLPWAHADLLKHHLNRLSKSGNLTESHDGCYLIDRPSSRSPSPSPSPISSSSPSPSSSSSPTYASSDTSGSDQSLNLKRGRKKKGNKEEQKIHPEYIKGRGRGWGRDMSCGNPFEDDMMKEVYIGEVADDICMHGMQDVEIHCLLTEDEAADENIQEKEQANQGYVDLGSREQQSMTNGRAPKPGPRITCATSRSPRLSLSPSPSPSSSSSPSYASSDTSGSDQSFNLKRERKKKSNCKRKKSQQKKRRGTKIHPKGRARGRGRGRGRSCGNPCKEDMMKEVYIGEVADDTCMHSMQTVEIHCLLSEDEATDENIKGKEQANQDYVDLGSREQQSMVNDIVSPPEHEYRIDEARIEPLQRNTGDDRSAPSTIPSSHNRKLTSEQGSKRVRQQKRNIHSRRTPQTGMGRGRSRKRETGSNMNLLEATEIRAVKVVNKRKTREQTRLIEDRCFFMNDDNMYVNRVEHEEGDSLDELIDQVYVELTEATETLHLTMDGESAEGNLRREELRQVGKNQEEVNVEPGTYNTGVTGGDSESSQHFRRLGKSSGTNQYRKLWARPSRKESTNVADRSEPSTARPELRRRKEGSARSSSRPVRGT